MTTLKMVTVEMIVISDGSSLDIDKEGIRKLCIVLVFKAVSNVLYH